MGSFQSGCRGRLSARWVFFEFRGGAGEHATLVRVSSLPLLQQVAGCSVFVVKRYHPQLGYKTMRTSVEESNVLR